MVDYLTDEIIEALAVEAKLQEPLANLDAYLSAALLGLLGIDEQGQQLLDRIDRPTLEALAAPSPTPLISESICESTR